MENEEQKRDRLRAQLDDTHSWPCSFSFKFILPSRPESVTQLKACFSDSAEFSERPSRNGNYIAFTVVEIVGSAENVFERYEAAAKIKGILSL